MGHPEVTTNGEYDKISKPNSLPATDLVWLPVPLLHTRLGNLKAPVDDAQPC